MSRLPAALVVLSFFACRALAAEAPAGLDRYNVIWDTPGSDSAGSMPVGNGDIGLNAWIEKNGDLVFYIGKCDAWAAISPAPVMARTV